MRVSANGPLLCVMEFHSLLISHGPETKIATGPLGDSRVQSADTMLNLPAINTRFPKRDAAIDLVGLKVPTRGACASSKAST
jgi:hypothetical protein